MHIQEKIDENGLVVCTAKNVQNELFSNERESEFSNVKDKLKKIRNVLDNYFIQCGRYQKFHNLTNKIEWCLNKAMRKML
jgi:hypothetical protein